MILTGKPATRAIITPEALNFNEVLKQLELFTQNTTLDEEILHKLIERIEIKEDRSPRIFYRFLGLLHIFYFFSSNTQHST
jgi:hypothetical protein